jgi:hypothetical protein
MDLINYTITNIVLVNTLIEIQVQVEIRVNIISQLSLCCLTRVYEL